jgi:hypothetical protein
MRVFEKKYLMPQKQSRKHILGWKNFRREPNSIKNFPSFIPEEKFGIKSGKDFDDKFGLPPTPKKFSEACVVTVHKTIFAERLLTQNMLSGLCIMGKNDHDIMFQVYRHFLPKSYRYVVPQLHSDHNIDPPDEKKSLKNFFSRCSCGSHFVIIVYRGVDLSNWSSIDRHSAGLPDVSLYHIPDCGEIYQVTTKCTKWP